MPTSAERYERDMRLMVDVLRIAAREPDFALKGGTAINLFVRDLPRYSVDIDLTFLPTVDRAQALAAIGAAMRRIGAAVKAELRRARVSVRPGGGALVGLQVDQDGARTKIDVTPVLRGTVFPSVVRQIVPAGEERFRFLEVRMVSFADLYGGKLSAAVDRQHPRDLFDVHLLLQDHGIDDALWRAFLVYATCSSRPIQEMLDPAPQPLQPVFERDFAGMPREPVTLETLERAREQLIAAIHARLDDASIAFLSSIETESPDWDALGLPHVAELPGMRWKLQNLRARNPAKRAADRKRFDDCIRTIRERGANGEPT